MPGKWPEKNTKENAEKITASYFQNLRLDSMCMKHGEEFAKNNKFLFKIICPV